MMLTNNDTMLLNTKILLEVYICIHPTLPKYDVLIIPFQDRPDIHG